MATQLEASTQLRVPFSAKYIKITPHFEKSRSESHRPQLSERAIYNDCFSFKIGNQNPTTFVLEQQEQRFSKTPCKILGFLP
ncbi:hypothetical protein L2E82_15122 [Cichorium intybus]|uniref:Uncharacterized protein n=1 Tax=Cichorium intybus TaxID=13427 RepID=A0ACB9F1Y5_CICIN|nr:hypothetical protein L2E82_15122 [Cichorium intybus]